MKYTATYGELSFQVIKLVEHFNNKTSHTGNIRSYLDAITTLPTKKERTFDTHKRRQRCLVAM